MSAISKGCALGAALIAGVCVGAPSGGGPDRYGYCSVAGNTSADGTPLQPGTFLNLELGQPDRDAHYTGATPAFWVEGVGITCNLGPGQASIAAQSTTKVDHVGHTGDEDGPLFYTFIPTTGSGLK